jgi:hypothetical protein
MSRTQLALNSGDLAFQEIITSRPYCESDLENSPPAEKNGRLGYHPDLNPPPATEAGVPVERGGLAPLYGLSRTTKSPSQPRISSTPTPEQ